MRQRDATHALPGKDPFRPVSNSPSHWYWWGASGPGRRHAANTRAPTLPFELYPVIIARYCDIARENVKKERFFAKWIARSSRKKGLFRAERAVRQERIPKPAAKLVWAAVASKPLTKRSWPNHNVAPFTGSGPSVTGPVGMRGWAAFRLGHAIPGIRRHRVSLSPRQARKRTGGVEDEKGSAQPAGSRAPL